MEAARCSQWQWGIIFIQEHKDLRLENWRLKWLWSLFVICLLGFNTFYVLVPQLDLRELARFLSAPGICGVENVCAASPNPNSQTHTILYPTSSLSELTGATHLFLIAIMLLRMTGPNWKMCHTLDGNCGIRYLPPYSCSMTWWMMRLHSREEITVLFFFQTEEVSHFRTFTSRLLWQKYLWSRHNLL